MHPMDPLASHPAFREASELPALLSYLRQGRCVLFVGAGLSRPAGYPDWATLMRQVVEGTAARLGDAAGRPALDQLLTQGRFTDVADQCRTLLGRARFGQLLRSLLARDAAPPEATHRAIVATPYASIITTNFDTLLEDAYARWSDFGVPKAPTGAELAQHGTLLLDGAFFILKAHGSIDDEASLVFTSEDYRRVTHANPAFQAVMSALLLTHAVLFVGYSLGDPNFRMLIDSQLSTFGGEAPPRYALMENVSATERAILRRTAGIEVISFAAGAFGEVAGLLQHLAQAVREDTAPDPAAPGPTANATVAPSADPSAAAATAVAEGASQRRPVARATPAARQVLRPSTGEAAFVLRLRARDAMIDSEWFLTHTRDLDGTHVPLKHIHISTTPTPDWTALSRCMSQAVDTPFDDKAAAAQQQVGQVLSDALTGAVPALRALPAHTTVVLDLDRELSTLPWEWLQVGAGALASGWPVCRRPPELRDASRGRPLMHWPPSVLLVGDTLSDLPPRARMPLHDARAEITQLADRLRQAIPGAQVRALVGEQACYAHVLQALRQGRYDIVHFAGMSHYDDAGSYLMLHDGNVHATELVTLLIQRPPALLFLNALYTGFVPAFCDAFNLPLDMGGSFNDHFAALKRHRIGFDRAAARAGVGTFIGTLGGTGDTRAKQVALAFYDALLEGQTTAQALCRARAAPLATGPGSGVSDEATAGLFGMAGYADLRLVPAPTNHAARAPVRNRAIKRSAARPATG